MDDFFISIAQVLLELLAAICLLMIHAAAECAAAMRH